MKHLALILGAIISMGSRITGKGAGITWQGEIGLRVDPNLAQKLAKDLDKVIVIAGTNGKTTTASMIAHILFEEKIPHVHNKTGANLLNGVTGTLMEKRAAILNDNKTIGVLEVDEAALPQVLSQITPDILVLLNLFRDQLDRYGEVDAIANSWKGSISLLLEETVIIANADDPMIVSLAEKHKGEKRYFGLGSSEKDRKNLSHASDTIYCPECSAKLIYKHVYLAHYGDWKCDSCGFARPDIDVFHAETSLKGRYNLYNAMAAKSIAEHLRIYEGKIRSSLLSFEAAFGRQESFVSGSTNTQLFLSKNPAGFNESLKTVLEQDDVGTIILALNDRIPDGTDVSWIWDVDFEQLKNSNVQVICTGDRAYDMGLRIFYAHNGESNTELVVSDYEAAINKGKSLTPQGKTLYILPTYSAMLDIRKLLTGRKIL